MRLTLLASCLFLAASACTVTTGTESTTRYQTSDLAPSFIATSDGSTLTVRTQLFAHFGGSRALELGDGDQLQVTLDGAPVALAPDADAYAGRAAQPRPPALGLVQVLFLRTKTTGEATASTVFVPDPFTIDSVPDAWNADESELAVRTHGIKGRDADVLLEGSCLRAGQQALNVIVAGNGDVVIPRSRVELEDAADCDLEVSVRVTKTGAIDPALSVQGGEGIRAAQERRFTVHVAS